MSENTPSPNNLTSETSGIQNLPIFDFSNSERGNSNLRIALYSFFSTFFIVVIQLVKHHFMPELSEHFVTFSPPAGIIVGDFIYISALNRNTRKGWRIKTKLLEQTLERLEKQKIDCLNQLSDEKIKPDVREVHLEYLRQLDKQKLEITKKIADISDGTEWYEPK